MTKKQQMAERVGFEPTVRIDRTPDFESGAFDHSATSPSFASVAREAGEYSKAVFLFAAAKKDCAPARARKPGGAPQPMRSTPPMYGTSAFGKRIDPSACWPFSSTATSARPTASPEPFSVCTKAGLPSAPR